MQRWHDLPADQRRRARMVRDQLSDHQVPGMDPRVREAMAGLPRHWFVAPGSASDAYADCAVAIGHQQTISQPRVVAFMLSQLQLQPGQRVLDVGAGSGYVTALLAAVLGPAGQVQALERQPGLVAQARAAIAAATAKLADTTGQVSAAVALDTGDGYAQNAEQYDRIHVACAAPELPAALLDQLAPGGRLMIPIGQGDDQRLYVYTRDNTGAVHQHDHWPVLFVPMLPGVAPDGCLDQAP